MTVLVFLMGSAGGAIISWAIVTLVVTWVDPQEAGLVGMALFFLSLFFAIASSSALAGYGLRRIAFPERLAPYRVRPSLRQGILLGLFFDILLFLQLQDLIRWWISVILILICICLEFVFVMFDHGRRTLDEDI